MTVYFIGAGPGDPELLTIKAQRIIARAPLILYAGSLIPPAVLQEALPSAEIIDTAPLTLDAVIDKIVAAHEKDQDIARLQSGDPSLYGAIGEQMRRLDALSIAYEVIPGVSAYAAAAAALKKELTLPEVSQSIILTRVAGEASPMPPHETLEQWGQSRATLVLHLGIRQIRHIVTVLMPFYGEDCPVAVVYRVGWPDQMILQGTLTSIAAQVRSAKITRTALIIVGRVLAAEDFADSRLYHPDHRHILRPRG